MIALSLPHAFFFMDGFEEQQQQQDSVLSLQNLLQ
jgi:hypothetical protein